MFIVIQLNTCEETVGNEATTSIMKQGEYSCVQLVTLDDMVIT